MGKVVKMDCCSCGAIFAVSELEYRDSHLRPSQDVRTIRNELLSYNAATNYYVCPKCNGEVCLSDTSVSAEDGAEGFHIIKINAVTIEVSEYEAEEARLKRAQDSEKTIQQILELLKPLVAENVAHLERLEGKTVLKSSFHTEPEDREKIALVNQLVRVCSRATQWSMERAIDLAVGILEDVNMHDESREVARILTEKNPKTKHLISYHLE